MCRVLTIACRECVERRKLVEMFVKALIKASKHDPRLATVSRGARSSHGDGWGYALAMESGSGVVVAYDRFPTAIYSPSSRDVVSNVVSWIARYERCIALMHSRASSRGEPLGTMASHPFMYRVRIGGNEVTMFFAHNGGSDKSRLMKDLRGLGLSLSRHIHSDSYMLGLAIAKRLEKLGEMDRDAVLNTIASTVSTYCRTETRVLGGVTSTLIVSDDDAFSVVTSWFSEERAFYYQPLIVELGAFVAIASPTVIDFANVPRDLVKPMPNGSAALIDFSGLRYMREWGS